MKVTAQLMDENRYSASCQIWNNDMTKLVNECKQEEIAWYNSPRITENGFITTTQNLWYTHCLNKKRLAMEKYVIMCYHIEKSIKHNAR